MQGFVRRDLLMFFKYDHTLVEKAKELRKNMTPEECKLWYSYLRKYPVRFLHQKVLDRYILDFYCSKARLCIEIDGKQHLSRGNREHDALRSGRLARCGIETIRFFNDQINLGFEEVCRQIDLIVKERLQDRLSHPGQQPNPAPAVSNPPCEGGPTGSR